MKLREREKRDAFVEEFLKRGAKKGELKPPFYRLLWALGVNIPPPLFASGLQQFLINGICSGALFGISMGLTVWRQTPESSFAGGFFFGLGFALFTHFQIENRRRKFKIAGSWASYSPNLLASAEQVEEAKPGDVPN